MNSVFEFFKSTIHLTRFWHSGRWGVLQLITLLLLLCCFQPAFATPTTPTSDFIDNQDGTVTHKTTGLTWMRCAMGQTWTGSSCSGSASTYTYAQAVTLTRTFAGHSDWRLPNIAELPTIVERENYNPAINTTLFPNTPSWGFWSASPYAGYSDYAWIVYFFDGHGYYDNKYDDSAVRLVRGGQSFGSLPLTTPTSDFINNQNGTVTHKRTGLMWQRCAVGQTWTGSSCSGSVSTYTYNQALALTSTFAGHNDWRVPNANELLSIVEYGAYYPAINTTLFPNMPSYVFWSASPYAGYSGRAWVVGFDDGGDGYNDKGSFSAVRLVRGGQSFDPLTVSIAQSPLSAPPGKLFVQWGNGFTPNTTATLHVQKPDGTEYPTQQQAIDANGHFGINYKIPANKPAGTYQWWAVDGSTGKSSETISYQVTPLINVAKIYGKLHSNAAGGAALSGAKVSTGITAATTASDGSFSLAKIPAGQQVINFSKTGYQPFSVTIPVPGSGSYTMGNRWLVQNGLVKPTIAQAPMSGLPGTTFIQWGTGFTPNNTATLHFKKPDGTEYPPVTMGLDKLGHLETPYPTQMNKPAGVYSWWAVDNASGKTSNTVAYTVTQAVNPCQAPTKYDALFKITTATCRDKWNLTIFYLERYNGFLDAKQKLIQKKIDGTLDANSYVSIGLDLGFSLLSIHDIPSLKKKDMAVLFGIGVNQSLQFEAKTANNQFADIWYGAVGAFVQSAAEGNPTSTLVWGLQTSFGAVNNIFATIGVTTLTKRFQEVEIAKQYLLDFYRNGSRMSLVAADYGLPANARMVDIIEAIGIQIGAESPWYWFDGYNANNVVDLINNDTVIVSLKQVEYSK